MAAATAFTEGALFGGHGMVIIACTRCAVGRCNVVEAMMNSCCPPDVMQWPSDGTKQKMGTAAHHAPHLLPHDGDCMDWFARGTPIADSDQMPEATSMNSCAAALPGYAALQPQVQWQKAVT